MYVLEEKRKLSAGQAVHRFRVDESLANPHLTLYGGNFVGFLYRAAHEAARIFSGSEVINVNMGDVSIDRSISVGQAAFSAARVTYASKTALETEVFVVMDDAELTPVVRAAHLTFVAVDRDGEKAALPAPIISSDAERASFEAGAARRSLLLAERAERNSGVKPLKFPSWANESLEPAKEGAGIRDLRTGFAFSQHIVMPGEANSDNTIFGGVLAGLMDSTAGIACSNYALRPSVTVSIHGIHFDKRLRVGDIAVVAAQVAFVGSSSMTVKIDVDRRKYQEWSPIARDAFFTFIGVDEEKKPAPVPKPLFPSELKDMFERARFMQSRMKQVCSSSAGPVPLERGRNKIPVFTNR